MARTVCRDSGHVIRLSIIPLVFGIVVVAGSGTNTSPNVSGIAVDVLSALQVTWTSVATYFSYCVAQKSKYVGCREDEKGENQLFSDTTDVCR